MTTTHTSGSWHVTGDERGTMITDNTGGQLAIWPEQGGTVEQCANARLIAAAPDLLAALRGVMAWWADTLPPRGADDEMPAHLFDAAHAAIARATGAEE